jgi:hypothetical protein
MPKPTGAPSIPVSPERVVLCQRSALFWVDELPRYADRQQRTADAWAIAAGVLGAVTSLSIWPVLGQDSSPFAKFAISAVALLAAVCALVPRVKNYGEMAGQARELSSQYGSLVGELADLANMKPLDQQQAHALITRFQSTKEKKDALRGLPDRARVEIELADMAVKVEQAKQRLADAERVGAEAAKAAAAAKGAPSSRR